MVYPNNLVNQGATGGTEAARMEKPIHLLIIALICASAFTLLFCHYCQGQEEESESRVKKAIVLVLTYDWDGLQEDRLLGPTEHGRSVWAWLPSGDGFWGGPYDPDLGLEQKIFLSREEMLRFWEVVFSGEYLKIAQEEQLKIPQADMEWIWGGKLWGFLYRCGKPLGKEVITMFLQYNDLSKIDGITAAGLQSYLWISELPVVPVQQWPQWFSENKDKLLWDFERRCFVLAVKKTIVKKAVPTPVSEKLSLVSLFLPFLPFIIAVLLILASIIIWLPLRKRKRRNRQPE